MRSLVANELTGTLRGGGSRPLPITLRSADKSVSVVAQQHPAQERQTLRNRVVLHLVLSFPAKGDRNLGLPAQLHTPDEELLDRVLFGSRAGDHGADKSAAIEG